MVYKTISICLFYLFIESHFIEARIMKLISNKSYVRPGGLNSQDVLFQTVKNSLTVQILVLN